MFSIFYILFKTLTFSFKINRNAPLNKVTPVFIRLYNNTLYKHKGDRSNCNNYPGISLLGGVAKAFACVVLNRLK